MFSQAAIDRFWTKVAVGAEDDCWPWTAGTTSADYGSFTLGTREEGSIGAHVFSFELENGPVPKGKVVRHSCDNTLCCNPGHLVEGTYQQNSDDMRERERTNPLSRDRHPKSKVSEEDAAFIRTSKMRPVDLARKFGVAKSTISYIQMTEEQKSNWNERQRRTRAARKARLVPAHA